MRIQGPTVTGIRARCSPAAVVLGGLIAQKAEIFALRPPGLPTPYFTA